MCCVKIIKTPPYLVSRPDPPTQKAKSEKKSGQNAYILQSLNRRISTQTTLYDFNWYLINMQHWLVESVHHNAKCIFSSNSGHPWVGKSLPQVHICGH